MPSYIRTRSEFTVNSFTAESQTAPSVATFADGGFIVTWVTTDPTQDGSENAIKAQLFDSAGRKVGFEFLVNSDADSGQFTPNVATLPNGNFLITWVSDSSDGANRVKAQLFGRNGDPIGEEFQVNVTGSSLFEANVTSLADGRFIISWDDWNSGSVKGQIFGSGGTPVGNVLTLGNGVAQGFGDVVGLANGGFVATYRVNGNSWDVRAQVFSASGTKVGLEFLVNTTTAGSQNSPDATALASGGFVITWSESNPEYSSGNTRIKAQMYTASGERVGGELLVSTQGAASMGGQVVTALPDGGFFIAWYSFLSPSGSDSEIKAQRFAADGSKVDAEFQVNTLTSGAQWLPDLATLADGRVVAVWSSAVGDPSGGSVRAQILGTEAAAPLANTSPVIISNGGGASVSLTHDEGATTVTTVVASDDGEPNNLRYSITGGADSGLFAINALTGALAFKAAPDHVAGGDNSYSVIVTASDGQLTGSQSVEIFVRHVNYVTIISDGGYSYADIWMDENQTAVTVVSAIDEDGASLTYSITGGYDAALFTIDSQTGELRFAVAPDYEMPTSMYGGNAYNVQVTATDGIRSDSQDVRVYVNDVEEPLGFAIVSDGGGDYGQISVNENGLAVTTVVVSGAAGPVTYEIVGGADASWFEINSETGELKFVELPDYETGKNGGYGPYNPYGPGSEYNNLYDVVVRASDGVSFDVQELEVRVEDIDEAPTFTSHWGQEHVSLSVPENAIAHLEAWAEDPDRYGWVTYRLEGADAALFELDPYYGGLKLRQGLDHEAPIDADGDNVYEVSVVASSGDLSATQSFSITVEDYFEQAEISSNGGGDSAIVFVQENGTEVTTVTISGDGPVDFEIAGGADAAWFTIDRETGLLSFRAPANYESNSKVYPRHHEPEHHGTTYDVIVSIHGAGSYDEQRLSVRVTDVDEAPVISSYGGQDSVALTVNEYLLTAATVRATDPERGLVTFALAGADAALFDYDPSTGALKFREGADFEAPADADGDNVYEVAVVATAGALSSSQAFSITIANVDENVAITSNGGGDSAAVSVAENGTAVTVVAAATGFGPLTYSIVGGADAHEFTINASTGALAFASAPNFEMPVDSDGDNAFDVIVRASNAMNSDDQQLSVVVQDVDEAPSFYDYMGNSPYPLSTLENETFIADIRAHDPDGGAAITYSITGGADSAKFVIDPQTGALSWRPGASPDHEAPTDADGDNVYELDVTAAQGSWSRTQALTVNVLNENERPRIVSDGGGSSAALELDEGQTAVTTVVANDPDGPGAITYSITGGWSADLFAIDSATGALRFISAPNYEAPVGESNNFYTVEVTASDGQLSTRQSIQILVRDVEEGVTITTPSAVSMDEETGLAVRVAATDGDGDPITYSIAGGADSAHFMIDAATGDLTTVTLLDFEAPVDADGDNVYEVTVRASDGQNSDDRQMSITIDDVDDDVEIVSYGGADLVSLTMQESSSFTVADVDANMSSFFGVRFSIGGGADASKFIIDPNTGVLSFSYPFMPNFEAPADADRDNVYDVVVVANRLTTSDSQAFAITITNRNEGLWITSDGSGDASLSVDEGDRSVTTVVAFDPDGDVPAYSIAGGADAARFAIDPATGALSFIDAPNFEAPADSGGNNVYNVIVAASDGSETDTQVLEIRVGNVNEAPAITSGGGGESAAVTVNENGLAAADVDASDADGTILTYSITGGADASRFTIESWSGVLRFKEAPNFEAPGDSDGNNVYDVVVSVTDGLLTDSQAIAVTVANLAETVTITSNGGGAAASVAVAENGIAVATVAASSPDGGGPLVYAIAGGADSARFTINASTGALAFLAAPNFEAPGDAGANNVYDVVVSASNGATVDTQALAVTVGNVDEQMAITSNGGGAGAAVSVNENMSVVTTVVGTDPDGGPVSYVILHGGDSGLFTIDPATGVLAFRAPPNFEAPGDSDGNNVYTVTVMASDGHWSDDQTITVTVGNVNEAPVITSSGGGASGAVSVAENSLAVVTVASSDAEGSARTYSIVGGADAARFTINPQTGALQFVAAPDWELPADSNQDNVYAVVVRASDGQLFDDQALSVTVANRVDGNVVTGTNGGDSISATSTSASLRTSNEEDTVFGRDGHDTIQGMAGDDEIHGENGNDTLVGGAGSDRLTGGLGKDQFTYNSVSDSTAAARDMILDFSRSQGDKISLTAIDANSLVSNNQAFTFIGSSAFSGVAGQLRFETANGVTTISGDVNGDGLADLQIQLSGSVPLIASDFLL
ncbi:MAG TPA: cadherin domain-containing protein [Allosphingosinicella sp.]|jgi:hypothetical protein